MLVGISKMLGINLGMHQGTSYPTHRLSKFPYDGWAPNFLSRVWQKFRVNPNRQVWGFRKSTWYQDSTFSLKVYYHKTHIKVVIHLDYDCSIWRSHCFMSALFGDGGIRFARSLLLPTFSCHHRGELVFKTRFLTFVPTSCIQVIESWERFVCLSFALKLWPLVVLFLPWMLGLSLLGASKLYFGCHPRCVEALCWSSKFCGPLVGCKKFFF